jgi:hypothetical protein
MGRAKQLGGWLWQAWPIWAIAGIAGVNYGLFRLISYDRASVHSIVGPILQMVGGASVLYFLNKNMGAFNRGTLIQRVIEWVKSCPIRKKHYVLHAGSATIQAHSEAIATGQVTRGGETIQEQLDALKRLVEQHHKEMKDGDKKLRADLESTRDQLRSEISAKGEEIAKMRSLLATTVVGSVNPQFFGVLLLLYGTALPLIK